MPEHFTDADLVGVRLTMRKVALHAEHLEARAHDYSKSRFLVQLQQLRAITNELEHELLDERLR